jgi:gliding motility-associated-like protein
LLPGNADLKLVSATCNQDISQQVPRVSVQELTPICPSQQGQSSCNGGPIPGVEEHIYEREVNLGACPDWRLYTNICCRNYAITNLQNNNNTRTLIETTANLLAAPCNNSPVFSNKPVPYICSGEPYQYSNGATDADGDSLAYEIIKPREIPAGGNTPQDIDFVPGFSTTYPLETSPPNSFNFDVLSGQMAFTPQGAQQPVLSIRVKEYRNGVLIGSVIRDIQMVVLNCNNQSPVLNPPINVSGGVLNGQTFSVCAGSTLSFELVATDPDVGQTLTLDDNVSTNIPGATVVQSGNNPLSAVFTFPTTLADTGGYSISFTLKDDGCPLISQQNVGYNIVVAPNTVYPRQEVLICPSSSGTVQLQSNLPNTSGGTYQWTPATGLSATNIPNPVANFPAGGSITYTVSYVGGSSPCPLTEEIRLRPNAVLNLNDDSLRICLGDSAQLTANLVQIGGQVPVTYSWDPPGGLSSTTIRRPKASPGSSQLYTVTATTLSCAYDAEVWVEVVEPPQLNPLPDADLCSGDSVLLLGTGLHLEEATFRWNPVNGLRTPFNDSTWAVPGNSTVYTLRATNDCGSDQVSSSLTVFAPLTLSLAVDQVTCNGANDGRIGVVATGGDGNPSFTWQPGGSSNDTLINLAPGSYRVVATDAVGCNATDTALVTEPTALTATASLDMVACFGQNNGSITVSANGGTPGYRYALNGGPFQSSATFNNLIAGTYTVVVRDANLCLLTLPVQTITQPLTPVTLNLSAKTNASCNGTLGSINVSANGGTDPFEYRLNNGPWQPGGQFTNLSPGSYLVRVRDFNGCPASLTVDVFEITDPSIAADSIRPITCYGGNDGWVRVVPQGGTPPYLLSLDGGPFAPDTIFPNLTLGLHTVTLQDAQVPPCTFDLTVEITQPDSLYAENLDIDDVDCAGGQDGSLRWRGLGGIAPYVYAQNGAASQADSLFAGLSAGTYTLVINDANGCPSQPIQATVTEPAPLQLTGQTLPVRCFGEANGSLTLSSTGGTRPHRFGLAGGPLVSDSAFGGLVSGSYSIRVIDHQQCVDSISLQVAQPDSLVLSVAALQDVACYGDSTGVISVQTEGGTLPYQWALEAGDFGAANQYDSLPAGPYRVIVRDERGCQDATDTVITEPTPLAADVITTPESCFGAEDGTAEVLTRGGTGPYQYLWDDNGSTEQIRTGLMPQALFVEVMDALGCLTYVNSEIIGPSELGLDSSLVQDVACYGEATGLLFVRGSGGEPPYQYQWDDASTDTLREELPADTYYLTITDSLACSYRDTLVIAQSDSLSAQLVERQDAFCAFENGLLRVSPQGGVPPYQLAWETDSVRMDSVAGNLFAPVGDTTYYLTVVDSLGCSIRRGYPLSGEGVPSAAFTNQSGRDTILFTDGLLQWINQSSGASSYEWMWGNGRRSLEVNPTYRYDEPGTYEVTLVANDARYACPDTATRPLVLLPLGQIFVPNAFTPNGDPYNQTFRVVGQGIEQLELRIFNRWGKLIYVINSPEAGWDGRTQNGASVPEGVYVFVMKAGLVGGTQVTKSGTITLFR